MKLMTVELTADDGMDFASRSTTGEGTARGGRRPTHPRPARNQKNDGASGVGSASADCQRTTAGTRADLPMVH